MNKLRYWTIAALLAGTMFLLYARPDTDRIPPREPLQQFPNAVAGWTGTDLPIAQESLDVLGSGDFLSRRYIREGDTSSINLFIGYFPTQRTGSTIHSPKHCLPGSGWIFESSSYVDLKDVDNKPHRVGEYIIANGDAKDFVIYWYQAHGRSVASEYMAKVYLVTDAMRTNRTDGALVRVITSIGSGEQPADARSRAEAFAAHMAPVLGRFIPN